MNTDGYLLRCPKAHMADWADAPAALAMDVDAEGALCGTWNGRIAVRVLHRCVSTQTRVEEPFRTGPSDGSNWHYETGYSFLTRFEAALDPALGLALIARQIPPAMKNRTSFDPEKGPAPEAHFGFYGLDREHTGRVLAAVMEEVLRGSDLPADGTPGAAPVGTYNLMLTDTRVTALSAAADYVVDVEALRAGIARVGRVAEALLDARAAHLAPGEAEARSSWAAVASRLGLRANALDIAGTVAGDDLHAFLTIEPNPDPGLLPTHATTRVHVAFANPLGCEASLAAQPKEGLFRGLVSRVFGPTDLVLGDTAFDAAFLVRGRADALRVLLTPLARQRLLDALALAPTLTVTDQRLDVSVPRRIADGEELAALLRALLEAAAALRTR